MYGKVFDSMFDGTLASRGPWQALVTFQQMIVLANPDGIVDMTADAISRRTSIPLEIIELGISELMRPDPKSRTPDEEGRRIVLVDDHRDWGWQIVNHAKYQAMRNAAERREYLRIAQAERRARIKAESLSTSVNNVNNASQKVNTSTASDADADADKHSNENKRISKASPSQGAGKPPPTAIDEGRFPDFWSAWPKSDRKQDRKKCLAKWRKLGADAYADRIISHVLAMAATKKWRDGYDPLVMSYLNGERWEDPIPPDRVEPEAKTAYTREREGSASAWMGQFGAKTVKQEDDDAARLTLE